MKSGCVIILLCLATIGCSMPYKGPLIEPEKATIAGIKEALSSKPELVDVLLIHGVGYHDQQWAADANAALAQALGRKFDRDVFLKQKGEDLPNRGVLYSARLDGGTGQVNTYAIVWAPVVKEWKQTLCYDASVTVPGVCDDAKALNTKTRARFNGSLKSAMLDGALSDAIFYISPEGGRLLRKTVRAGALIAFAGGHAYSRDDDEKAFKAMADRAEVPLFMMSESLGSKILRDTLIEMSSEDGEERQKNLLLAVGRIQEIYMAANQIPLLSPTAESSPSLTTHYSKRDWRELYPKQPSLSGLRGLGAMVHEGRRLGNKKNQNLPLRIVAFSDPNDLLTYALRPYLNDPDLLDIVDVTVSNDWTYFGLLEDPWRAHTTYWASPAVETILRCGYGPQSAGCK